MNTLTASIPVPLCCWETLSSLFFAISKRSVQDGAKVHVTNPVEGWSPAEGTIFRITLMITFSSSSRTSISQKFNLEIGRKNNRPALPPFNQIIPIISPPIWLEQDPDLKLISRKVSGNDIKFSTGLTGLAGTLSKARLRYWRSETPSVSFGRL